MNSHSYSQENLKSQSAPNLVPNKRGYMSTTMNQDPNQAQATMNQQAEVQTVSHGSDFVAAQPQPGQVTHNPQMNEGGVPTKHSTIYSGASPPDPVTNQLQPAVEDSQVDDGTTPMRLSLPTLVM